MNLYLVKGTVETRRYMSDSVSIKEVIRLVRASSDYEAEGKFMDHWAAKNDPYSISYWAQVLDCSEVIE